MSNGFWDTLKKPVVVLAPMADVTDAAFRRMFAKYGKPDVTWTEFISADGLFRGGFDHLERDLWYTEEERPVVAQFFSQHDEYMQKAAELAVDRGFDGVDINMGCPDRNICRQGSGAALIKNPQKAREVIRAAKRGAEKDGANIPVSVKTRIGFNTIELDAWLPELLAEDPAVVTLHARTRKEMSKVPAHWDEVARGVEIRGKLGSSSLIFGNGDVTSIAEAHEKAKATGADGIMVGRGIFGNPWFFNPNVRKEDLSLREILEVLVEHTWLFDELLGKQKSFALMKKHFKAYVNGWDGAKELRGELMECANAAEVEKAVRTYLAAARP